MTPLLKKILVGIACFIAFIFLASMTASIFDDGSNTSRPVAAAPAPAPAPAAETSISLAAGQSTCLADPSTAKIYFFITLKNTGNASGEIDARPWRRYSDNEVNDSIVDTLTMTVPAGATKKFHAEFGYNAEAHGVLECGLIMGSDTEPTMIAVT